MAKGGEKSQEDIENGVHIANYVLSCNNNSTSDNCFEVDLESGVLPTKADKNCRICLEGTPESGIPILLGCSCKRDLATAHKQFKIKGNKACEICGLMTKNDVCVTETKVVVDQAPNETANTVAAPPTISWGSFLWNSFKTAFYFGMISNLCNYFLTGNGVYLYSFYPNVFFVIVWHCIDCCCRKGGESFHHPTATTGRLIIHVDNQLLCTSDAN